MRSMHESYMIKLLKRFTNSSSSLATFFRFSGVGLSISLIDIALLYLLKEIDFLNIFFCRSISLSTSILFGYFLNRYFTFHYIEIGRALWHSIIRHFSVHALGGMINMLIFLISLSFLKKIFLETQFVELTFLIAIILGGITGLTFNFFFSRKLVFDS
jgi:putative flippase GtrA